MDKEPNNEIQENILFKLLKIAQIKLLPDIIETKLVRKGMNAELLYQEFFTYVPDNILNFLIPIIVKILENQLSKVQFKMELRLIEKGVEIRAFGPTKDIVSLPLSEIMIFGNTNIDEIKKMMQNHIEILEVVLSSGKVISQLDENTKQELYCIINKLKTYMKQIGVNSVEEINIDEYIRNINQEGGCQSKNS